LSLTLFAIITSAPNTRITIKVKLPEGKSGKGGKIVELGVNPKQDDVAVRMDESGTMVVVASPSCEDGEKRDDVLTIC
jgi:biopolymer transport protein ExbD